MHHPTTILQYLHLRPGLTISDPSTSDGKLCNAALKRVSQQNGWTELHWGLRLSVEKDVVDLIITWNNHAALQRFLRDHYQLFLQDISSLLFSNETEGNLGQPAPYFINLHPGIPSLDLGTVSSIYELHFDEEACDEIRTGLGIEVQLCRQFFLDAANRVEQGDGFLGMDGVWIHEHSSASIPPPVSPSMTQGPQTGTKIFLIIMDFSTRDVEATIFNSDSITYPPLSANTVTTGEYFANNILQKCSRWFQHQVVFENVSASNVDWLDKEERWSGYVKRLMDEDDTRRGDDGKE